VGSGGAGGVHWWWLGVGKGRAGPWPRGGGWERHRGGAPLAIHTCSVLHNELAEQVVGLVHGAHAHLGAPQGVDCLPAKEARHAHGRLRLAPEVEHRLEVPHLVLRKGHEGRHVQGPLASGEHPAKHKELGGVGSSRGQEGGKEGHGGVEKMGGGDDTEDSSPSNRVSSARNRREAQHQPVWPAGGTLGPSFLQAHPPLLPGSCPPMLGRSTRSCGPPAPQAAQSTRSGWKRGGKEGGVGRGWAWDIHGRLLTNAHTPNQTAHTATHTCHGYRASTLRAAYAAATDRRWGMASATVATRYLDGGRVGGASIAGLATGGGGGSGGGGGGGAETGCAEGGMGAGPEDPSPAPPFTTFMPPTTAAPPNPPPPPPPAPRRGTGGAGGAPGVSMAGDVRSARSTTGGHGPGGALGRPPCAGVGGAGVPTGPSCGPGPTPPCPVPPPAAPSVLGWRAVTSGLTHGCTRPPAPPYAPRWGGAGAPRPTLVAGSGGASRGTSSPLRGRLVPSSKLPCPPTNVVSSCPGTTPVAPTNVVSSCPGTTPVAPTNVVSSCPGTTPVAPTNVVSSCPDTTWAPNAASSSMRVPSPGYQPLPPGLPERPVLTRGLPRPAVHGVLPPPVEPPVPTTGLTRADPTGALEGRPSPDPRGVYTLLVGAWWDHRLLVEPLVPLRSTMCARGGHDRADQGGVGPGSERWAS
jgi:hypothetical protein